MRGRHLVLLCLGAITVGLAGLKPASFPPIWFDEGWVLSVARNWAEKGTYSQLLMGRPVPADMLNVGSPAVVPVAMAFRLFGIGIWQGRLFSVLCMLVTLILLYALARKLYDESVAVGALAVVLVMSGTADLHPVVLGKQVLGEMPAMLYLLAGYVFFLAAPARSLLYIPMAALFWALAAMTKFQVTPFLLFSLAGVVAFAALARCWKTTALVSVTLGLWLAVFAFLCWLDQALLHHDALHHVTGRILSIAAVVPATSPRIVAVLVLVGYGMPLLAATLFTAYRYVRAWSPRLLAKHQEVVRVSLLAFVASWLAWYLLGSAGWPRYLFPATFMGSILVSAAICEWTEGFNLQRTLTRAKSYLGRRQMDSTSRGALIAAALVLFGVPITTASIYRSFRASDMSAVQVAVDLNSETPPDALIETFDSELFFLLNRRYHYPSLPVAIQLNRRTFLLQGVAVDYNPLQADPDYIVVGPMSRLWEVYDEVVKSKQVRLLKHYSGYDIYQRVR